MYQATLSSVQQHPVPDWYQDAKLGIFIHWTISSVPAFAPTGHGDLQKILADQPVEFLFANQPYAEWYQNSLRIAGSPAQRYHLEKYGQNYAYEAFADEFNRQSQSWDPSAWTDLFQQAGARYVVLVTKHHDGFLLWPARTPNPFRPGYRSTRDITGELTSSVTSRGLKMGLYYSSALDWTFTPQPITNFGDLAASGPTSRQYRDYVENHWKELIERYDPWVLWSDIGYPPGYRLPELFAYYYNRKPEGVVNDRWGQLPALFHNRLGRWLINRIVVQQIRSGKFSSPTVPHRDYVTTEYAGYDQVPAFKWEACRGIGHSFAYNQFERAEDHLTAPALIRLLAGTVSNNGNLLINVGPRPDGSIPAPQVEALQGLGRWLAANGESIYATRPWDHSRDQGDHGAEVLYTRKGSSLYAIVSALPATGSLAIPNLPARQVSLLDTDAPLPFSRESGKLVIQLPAGMKKEEIPVVKIELM